MKQRINKAKKKDDSNILYLYIAIAVIIIGSLVAIIWYGSPDDRLLKAVKACDAATAKALLEKGANADVRTPEEDDIVNNAPALFFATRDGCAEIVTLLLTHNADVNAKVSGRHYTGWTALMVAADKGHIGIVRLLLEHDADVTLTSVDGDIALQLAETKGHIRIVELLQEIETK